MNHLPKGWASTTVSSVIELNAKTDAPDEALAGFSPMPLLGTRYRDPVGFEPRRWGDIRKSYVHFQDGDVLLAKITPCFENGKAGLVRGMPSGIGAGSSEYLVCRPYPEVLDPRYLLALLKTDEFLKAGETRMTGSVGHKRVPKDYLLETALSLAPRAEQSRIADKLDALLARVDACRERLNSVPKIIIQLRQSVLTDAVTGRLTDDWRVCQEYSESSLSITKGDESIRVPASWAETNLAGVIEPTRPLCYGVVQPGDDDPDGVSLVRVKDLAQGTVQVEGLRTIAPAVDQEYRRSRVKEGDLLVSVVGTIGRIAAVPRDVEANIARALARVSCRADVNSAWIHIWLSSPTVQWWLLNSSREVARKTLNLSDLAVLPVALPPVDEQAEIVRRVESIFSLADAIEAKCKTARAQVERLTHAILAKAFRGELVPQDPNDEPASALLARIAAERAAAPARRTRARKAPGGAA